MSSNLSTMRPPNLILIPTSLISFHLHFSSSTCLKTQHLVCFLHTSLSGSLYPCSLVLGECCDTRRGLCEWCVAAARLLSRTQARVCVGAANSLPPSGVRSRSQSLPSVSQLSQCNFCFLSIPYFFTDVTCQEEGSRIERMQMNDL